MSPLSAKLYAPDNVVVEAFPQFAWTFPTEKILDGNLFQIQNIHAAGLDLAHT